MSGEVEAGGALATASILSKTLERGSNHGAVGNGPCGNCGATVDGAYCSTCGQPVHIHRTVGHFIEEAIHGVFHFDPRAWRTLPMLAVRPGTLTRQYTMGSRARFISPVALFLFTIFLMFFVFAFAGGEPALGGSSSLAELRAEVAAKTSRLKRRGASLPLFRSR